MLSYRHAFHAGNHADVLKHLTLLAVIQYALQKEKPIHYVDTHAGAGVYNLQEGFAQKNAEYETGIAPLWSEPQSSALIEDYLECIRSFNRAESLTLYPGSPLIAAKLLRPCDKLHLFELHPNDFTHLTHNCGEVLPNKRQASIAHSDGLTGLKALLPPPSRRGIVLIDPPYEQKLEYRAVVDTIQEAIKRFETGTYLIWYPLLPKPEPQEMVQSLDQLMLNKGLNERVLNVTLEIDRPNPEGFGLFGSGMYVINPPWTLAQTLETTLPQVVAKLGKNAQARFTINQLGHKH